jgi:TolA-binding protein
LAQIQRWRTRLEAASTGDLEQWSRNLAAMPAEIQATGWYVLGDGYARHDEPERAAIAYLKPPIVFRQQRALAADGLLAAAGQLEKLGQGNEAAGLYREILRDFAHLSAAEQARESLARDTKSAAQSP